MHIEPGHVQKALKITESRSDIIQGNGDHLLFFDSRKLTTCKTDHIQKDNENKTYQFLRKCIFTAL